MTYDGYRGRIRAEKSINKLILNQIKKENEKQKKLWEFENNNEKSRLRPAKNQRTIP